MIFGILQLLFSFEHTRINSYLHQIYNVAPPGESQQPGFSFVKIKRRQCLWFPR